MVVLILKDALPVFWAIALLLILIPKWQFWLPAGTLCGFVLSQVIFNHVGSLSMSFDGRGFELTQGLLLIFCYLGAFYVFCLNQAVTRTRTIILICVLVTCVIASNVTNLLIFFSSFWRIDGHNNLLFVGLLLGLGICTSIATLLFLLVKPLNKENFVRYLLLIFVVGQVSQIAYLLQQTDLVTSEALWNTEKMLSDEQETGQFMTTLFGYESSPTGLYILIYVVALITPIAVRQIVFKLQQNEQEANS